MTRSEKLVAALVSQMDVEALRDLAALALRGVDAVALLTETPEERARRLDRERKKRTRAGRARETNRTLGGHSTETNRTPGGNLPDVEGGKGGGALGISPGISSDPEPEETLPIKPSLSLCQPETARAMNRRNPDEHFDGTVEAFTRAISPTGKHSGMGWKERENLSKAIGTHAPEGCDRAAWVAEATTAYAATADGQYRRRTLAHFIKWLDEGRPAQAPGGRTAIIQRNNKPEVITESLLEVGFGNVTPAAQARASVASDGTLDAWTDGIRDVTGKPVTALRDDARAELTEIVVAHALDVEERRAWLRSKVALFARAHDPKYGGWTPRTFAKWIDAEGQRPTIGKPVQRDQGPALATRTPARAFFEGLGGDDPAPILEAGNG